MTAPEPTPTAEHIDAVAERQAGAANALWNQANLVGQAIDQGRLDGTSGAAVAAAIRATTPREFARACSEATAPDPTAEHIDTVARIVHRFVESHDRDEMVAELLTSTDPAVHAALAAALPAEVMLAALGDRGNDAELARRLEWATGLNGATLLVAIRSEGLEVVRVTRWEVAP